MNKINNQNLSFCGIYKFETNSKNYNVMSKVINQLWQKEYKNPTEFRIYESYTTPEETLKGIYTKIQVCANDKYDNFIESCLKQKNIDFTRLSLQEVLDKESIFNRIVLPKTMSNKKLVTLNTKKIEKLFKESFTYISQNGNSGTIGDRYNGVKEFLSTGLDIEATTAHLFEYNGKLELEITDGRHRFAVMRDMGLDKVKFALDDNSIKLAKKYKLLA